MLEVTRQKAKEAVILLEVEGTEALRRQKNREGYALASLMEEKNKAEAVRSAADVSSGALSVNNHQGPLGLPGNV